ncbi:hypothetical protein AeMF1_019617 [Aphanomyces euteiches]|nr:hypothetical protein AeMF1_019617 [Aphanomyces euteiches]KAH9184248.1 hypothetical protein AeNC1_013779 [Aphanomyces euteiches]
MKRRSVLHLAAVAAVVAGQVSCPKDTPCYDLTSKKCRRGNSSADNGDGLVYCDPQIGFCYDTAVCYGQGSGCVCTGKTPCLPLGGSCVAFTDACAPINAFMKWCPDSPPPPPLPSKPSPSSYSPSTDSSSNNPLAPLVTSPSPASPGSSDGSSSASPLDNSKPGNGKEGQGVGVIIGAAIYGAVVAIAIAVFFVRRSKLSRQDNDEPHHEDAIPTLGAPHELHKYSKDELKFSPRVPNVNTFTGSTRSGMTTASRSNASSGPSMASFGGQLDMYELEMYRIAPHDIAIVKMLAAGAYGEVLLAHFNGETVAAKRLLPGKKSNMRELIKFIDEIKLHSRIQCNFIVGFVGVSWIKPADVMMLTEYMDMGDLRGLLHESTPETFDWPHKIQCAYDIVQALVYLHTLDPSVIHRDLKSRNVLVNSEMVCKVTDFGVSREFEDMETMTAGIGTYRWTAPEVLQDGHYAASADIFSFGVVLSELDTHLLPYENMTNERGNAYTDTAIIAKVMAGQILPSFTPGCPKWFSDLGQKCMALSPQERPTAMEVAYALQVELRKLMPTV